MIIKNLLLALACSICIIASSGCSTTKNDSRAVETGAIQETLNDVSGRYELIAVNGATIPATVSHDGTDIKVHSGVFEIKADGTCSSKTVFTPPSGGKVTRKVNATYTRNGSNLVMQWEGAGTTTGTIEDETFTMDNHGIIFVYSHSGRIEETMKSDQATDETPDFGDFSSETLTVKAWKALAARDYPKLFAYTQKCVELYGEEGKKMNAELTDFEPPETAAKKWALNDVGTSLFIMAKAYEELKMYPDAVKAYRTLANDYRYAQCWDPKGWYWHPAAGADLKAKELDYLK